MIRKYLATIAVLAVAGCSTEGPPNVIGDKFPPPVIFFDWDSTTLSQQSITSIRWAANDFKATGTAHVTVTGHTDSSGPESYNMALSLRRANAVKEALVRDGVPESAITIVGKGETDPLVPLQDGVREPQNRRVQIALE
jgi:OOP family OmpA-OmpF porin